MPPSSQQYDEMIHVLSHGLQMSSKHGSHRKIWRHKLACVEVEHPLHKLRQHVLMKDGKILPRATEVTAIIALYIEMHKGEGARKLHQRIMLKFCSIPTTAIQVLMLLSMLTLYVTMQNVLINLAFQAVIDHFIC
jgi:hypothetical protein